MSSKIVLVIEFSMIVVLVFCFIAIILSKKIENTEEQASDNDYISKATPSDSIYEDKDSSIDEFELYTDAKELYDKNATVLSIIKADTSNNIYDEKGITEELKERGFEQEKIKCNYSINGELLEEEKILFDPSLEKHPTYCIDYTNKNSKRNVEVIISDSASVMSYDCVTNSFYETIPNESEMIILNIGTVSNELLDKLTVDEIDKYIK